MQRQSKLIIACVAASAAVTTPVRSQEGGKYFAPPDQVIAIRAAHLFDAKSGSMLNNQIIVVRGDRIADVGEAVQIPAGATVIDLGAATMLPGMIDSHVHVNTGGVNLAQRALMALGNAQADLKAGF